MVVVKLREHLGDPEASLGEVALRDQKYVMRPDKCCVVADHDAPEGIALLEPTLDDQSPTERLLLYGDLLRAAGRAAEASAVYDRAART